LGILKKGGGSYLSTGFQRTVADEIMEKGAGSSDAQLQNHSEKRHGSESTCLENVASERHIENHDEQNCRDNGVQVKEEIEPIAQRSTGDRFSPIRLGHYSIRSDFVWERWA